MSREACVELARRLGIDPDAVIEQWGERAAIREFEGGQPRADAERDALADVRALHDRSIVGEQRLGPRSAVPVSDAAKKRSSDG